MTLAAADEILHSRGFLYSSVWNVIAPAFHKFEISQDSLCRGASTNGCCRRISCMGIIHLQDQLHGHNVVGQFARLLTFAIFNRRWIYRMFIDQHFLWRNVCKRFWVWVDLLVSLNGTGGSCWKMPFARFSSVWNIIAPAQQAQGLRIRYFARFAVSCGEHEWALQKDQLHGKNSFVGSVAWE